MRREGLQARGIYKEVPRPSRRLALATCQKIPYNILIDFIVNLPSSNKFINIIIVINYLIKMRYIIPIDLINIILVVECFIKYVFKLYRLPNLIISNYRS
jgi:hypothetical protein